MIHSGLGIYEKYFKCWKAEDILSFFQWIDVGRFRKGLDNLLDRSTNG